MIVLGVDPGSLVTGYGVVERQGKKLVRLASGVIKTGGAAMPLRLKAIYDGLWALIEQHCPDEFAIETAFFHKNVDSSLKLGQARAAAILAAVNHQIPTSEYNPSQVKQALTGSGAADKSRVAFMVGSILGEQLEPERFDETDGLAIAICHLNRLTLPGPGAAATGRAHSWADFVAAHPERIARR